MPVARVHGRNIGYDLFGSSGPLWVITPGGRYSREGAGVRELAEHLVQSGQRALTWDRPNCGESDINFDGDSESNIHASALLGLLETLDVGPAILFGGSAGSRISLLAALRQPSAVAGLALLWVSGGPFGLLLLGQYYFATSLRVAWTEGMAAVAELPEWAETVGKNPGNRERFTALDRRAFIATMERWMLSFVPRPDEVVPGLAESAAATVCTPTLVFRSGESDCFHPRYTTDTLAELLPNATLVDPPWPDTEWIDGWKRRIDGAPESPWQNWPALTPQLLDWAHATL